MTGSRSRTNRSYPSPAIFRARWFSRLIVFAILSCPMGSRTAIIERESVELEPYEAGVVQPLGYEVDDIMPAFSPDGKYIAFTRRFRQQRRDEIWMLSIGNTGKISCAPMVREMASDAPSSTDGVYLDFSWDTMPTVAVRTNAPSEYLWHRVYPFYVTSRPTYRLWHGWVWLPERPTGTTVQRRVVRERVILRDNGELSLPFLGPETSRPDGDRLAYSRNGQLYVHARSGTYRANLDTARLHTLYMQNAALANDIWADAQAVPSDGFAVWYPRWAPTAPPRIAFQTRVESAEENLIGNSDIYLLDVDGSNNAPPARLTALVETERAEATPSWSPNGEYLAYYEAYMEGGSARTDLRILRFGDDSEPPKSHDVEPNVYRSANDRGVTWVRSIAPNGTDDTWMIYTTGNNRDIHTAEIRTDGVRIQTLPGIVGDSDTRVITDVDGYIVAQNDATLLRVVYSASYGGVNSGLYVDEWSLNATKDWVFNKALLRPTATNDAMN